MKNFKLNLKLNKQEKEDLLVAISCFINETQRQIRLKNLDKEYAEKTIMEFANLESKIERNLGEYK
jgi:hypothetical protein